MFLSLQECIDMSDLTENEILAIAEHEEIPEVLALELGSYLVHSPDGEKRIKSMIQDDIKHAVEVGDLQHSAMLKGILKDFVQHHATA